MITGIQLSLFQGQEDKILKVKHYEDIVDNMKRDIRDYVSLLAQQQLTTKQSVEITTILEGASELERVGDHLESMLKYVLLATKEKVMVLDNNNRSKIEHIINRCVELSNLIQECNSPEIISSITSLIKQIEKDTKAAREYYIGCLRSGSWNLFSDMSFIEFITIMEKYTRHCRSFTGKYLKQLHETSQCKYKFVENKNGEVQQMP
jgi:Na+/phosphate symporter